MIRSRKVWRAAALALLGTASCSSSSPPSGGHIVLPEPDGGPLDAASDVTIVDSSGPADGTVDSTVADSPGNPDDAAPVDAAFACANPASIADCAYCLTRDGCVHCAATSAGPGNTLFAGVFSCFDCTACWTACAGSSFGCPKPPIADPCDTKTTSPGDCMGCEACSVMGATDEAGPGTCSVPEHECASSPSCAELLQDTEKACENLP
jgi:hypothetical protein